MTGRQGVLQLRAPTKNPDSKTPSDIFYVGLLTCARRGLIWGLVRRQAGEEQFNHRLVRIRAARSNLGLFLCRNKYKRAITARFHNVAKGNISRLRDSADISPPGTACPACAV